MTDKKKPKPTVTSKKKCYSPSDVRYNVERRWETNKRKRIEKADRQRSADQNKQRKVARGTLRKIRRKLLTKTAPTVEIVIAS